MTLRRLSASHGLLVRTLVLASLAGSLMAAVIPPAEAAAKKQAASGRGAGEAVGEKIDINTATFEQLQSLPGIGPALAGRIVEYREKNGRFKRPEELMNVRGIGEKSYKKLESRITVRR